MVNLYLMPLKSKLEENLETDNCLTTDENADEQPTIDSSMTAKAVLLCRPNSHPFQERTLILDQPVKVGRSVARTRPAPNNGIFDCKVLSRNHALLWYENGKFYLQDTKSSNGTFVNNQRLSKGSEESTPREVCSGDIVQFGVDVMENQRKVTHGCIVATLKLYLPDGKEAKASPSTVMLPSSPSTIATQDLYQLVHYLQEALHREQMIENKLSNLQKLIACTDEASESCWKALIDEDRLLTRLEILENQIQTCSKTIGEDTLRQEVVRLQEDKDHYQVTAKESLRKVLQEKLEAVRKLQDVERLLNNAENECKNIQQVYEGTQKELHDLAEKYNTRLKEIQDLTERLQTYESKDTVSSEKADIELEKKKLDDDDNEYSKEQSLGLKDIKNSSPDGEDSPNESRSALKLTRGVQVDLIIEGNLSHEVKGNFWQTREEIERLSIHLQNSEKELNESKAKVSDLNIQLHEAKTQTDSSSNLIKRLQEQIHKLEEELHSVQSAKESSDGRLTIIYKSEIEPPTPTVTLPFPPRSSSPRPPPCVTSNGDITNESNSEMTHTNSLKSEIEKLKELLDETRENKMRAEREVVRFKAELEDARNNVKKAADDANLLRQQLQAAQIQAKEKSDTVSHLQEQLKRADLSTRDVQEQVTSLKERLSIDQQRLKQKQEELDILKQQLSEAQHNYKQTHNEAEQLRNKIELLNNQNETHAALKKSNSSLDAQLQATHDECLSLKSTIQNLESELRQMRNEKAKLQEDYRRLSQSRNELNGHSDISNQQIESLHEEIETSKQMLLDAHSENIHLKERLDAYNEERTRLRLELDASTQDFQIFRYLVPLLVAGILFYVLHW